jgi:hypothetical protein
MRKWAIGIFEALLHGEWNKPGAELVTQLSITLSKPLLSNNIE